MAVKDITNYASMVKRIKAAKTEKELNKLDESLDRIYNAGVFTVNEFMRLDTLIIDRKIKLEL